ncbi:hypothetical protein CAOG_009361 [Capsaspora owczarzaki ATCC 30864]|uniref:Uncharacterized protein n=1 Tax=Capsaspora owczarzaki (strain ATCC 30864) TaxID=595528 RepID=A0A0D2X0P9_CAPO3|nr:hypothetical protein CAOG_009361 [Capsaspora owczarzaki ATCC 30864]
MHVESIRREREKTEEGGSERSGTRETLCGNDDRRHNPRPDNETMTHDSLSRPQRNCSIASAISIKIRVEQAKQEVGGGVKGEGRVAWAEDLKVSKSPARVERSLAREEQRARGFQKNHLQASSPLHNNNNTTRGDV